MSRRSFDDPNAIEARQALLDNRVERLHPKRHRTGKRSSRISAAKKQKAAKRKAFNDAARDKLHAKARAYWLGHAEEHP